MTRAWGLRFIQKINAKSSINNLLLFAGDFPQQDDLKTSSF